MNNLNFTLGVNNGRTASGWDKFGNADPTGSYMISNGGSVTNPNNALTYQWMQEANAFNAAEAEKNRQFQREMSNTAYQRAMKDMELAGLNPVLAGNLGGASTPAGSAAQANFTAAGANSSSWSSAQSYTKSINQDLYNMAKAVVEGVVQESTGDDLTTWATKSTNNLIKTLRDSVANRVTSAKQAGYGWAGKADHSYHSKLSELNMNAAMAEIARFFSKLKRNATKRSYNDYVEGFSYGKW